MNLLTQTLLRSAHPACTLPERTWRKLFRELETEHPSLRQGRLRACFEIPCGRAAPAERDNPIFPPFRRLGRSLALRRLSFRQALRIQAELERCCSGAARNRLPSFTLECFASLQ